MTRRFEKGRRCLLAAAVVLAAACQNEAAPKLQSEPAREPAAAPAVARPSHAEPSVAPGGVAPGGVAPGGGAAPVAAAPEVEPAAAPVARGGAVGLAKYEAAAPSTGNGAGSVPAADSPAAKPAAGQAVQGTAVSEEPFSIWLQSVSPIPAGSAATVEAVLVAKPPYHCNPDYPHKFKLAAAPSGLTYPETTVKGAKVTAARSVLPIPVQAASPGKAKVTGTLSFSVCDDERCLVEKRELSLDLEVK